MIRLRRLRRTSNIRKLVRESRLAPDNFIAPLFVVEGKGVRKEISSLPGQFHFSADMLSEELGELTRLGISSILLFGLPSHKDATGSTACDEHGVVQEAVRVAKQHFPDVLVFADLCLCEYTDHGHCGVLRGKEVDNDATVIELQKQALSLAKAGADGVAPSGMMDGAVGAIRSALDEAGFEETLIMAYSAKYASSYYGPFREAVQSAPSFGDRRAYQMDPANGDEALREIAADIEEGADIVMVKPALAYLDIVCRAKQEFAVPLAAYNVSGEYAMVRAAAEKGLIDEDEIILETLLSMRRAGADIIISYHAKRAAELLNRSPIEKSR